jgi:hypothetical protein
MANTVLTPVLLTRYLDSMFPIEDQTKANTRTNNIRDRVTALINGGKGNDGSSLWSAYNGVTEYVDHFRTVKNEGNRWEASVFGSGVDMKEKAFDMACALI